jgi:hypothetical protein
MGVVSPARSRVVNARALGPVFGAAVNAHAAGLLVAIAYG